MLVCHKSSWNGSVPALQADHHGIQIRGAMVPQYIFNRYRLGRVACVRKPDVFIGRAFVTWILTESTRMTAPTYKQCLNGHA